MFLKYRYNLNLKEHTIKKRGIFKNPNLWKRNVLNLKLISIYLLLIVFPFIRRNNLFTFENLFRCRTSKKPTGIDRKPKVDFLRSRDKVMKISVAIWTKNHVTRAAKTAKTSRVRVLLDVYLVHFQVSNIVVIK